MNNSDVLFLQIVALSRSDPKRECGYVLLGGRLLLQISFVQSNDMFHDSTAPDSL